MFISFEGGEGAGKTTQIQLLAEFLRAAGRDVVCTREPGGTLGAEAVRALLLDGTKERWTAETDALLIAAARADHVARLIRPALARGSVVLCDRFVHSTLAYQGGGGGLGPDDLKRVHDFASGALWPDLVIWLDLPPEEGLKRARLRAGTTAATDRFEQRDPDFHLRVYRAFADMAAADNRIVRIDARTTREEIAEAVRAAVTPFLG